MRQASAASQPLPSGAVSSNCSLGRGDGSRTAPEGAAATRRITLPPGKRMRIHGESVLIGVGATIRTQAVVHVVWCTRGAEEQGTDQGD
jgi:hypothetical protein